jgi:hypothetical protein
MTTFEQPVPGPDSDERPVTGPTADGGRADVPLEADPADVAEQAREVPLDEDDDREA